jgi:hypothetical protein
MPNEKYRLIDGYDLKTLNEQLNKLAEEGFKPLMMGVANSPASDADVKAKMRAMQGNPPTHIVVLLEKQG